MSPAGRPRTFDMEAVLESAMLLFWERGYESTSLAQLREATGLSSASLYGAFGSKEGLFEKAVEHYVAGPGRVTDVVADEEISPREAVAGLLHGSVSMQTDPSHPRGCLVALTGTVRLPGAEDAGVREVVAARRAVDRARIRACAVRGIAAGELAEDTDADAVTSMVHGFLLGISTQVCDGVPAAHLHAAADALLVNWGAPER
ncbi:MULTISPECIES: TetR/AcrR family transcriptional regulator [Streptomyces]|uniref:TetR/AcrR family transcriptional regulator n=1 Tax=Streptomyces glycanivorans TaxID=3033808 RepID=A0ABY9JHQ1_9ACTN|nr:MULTISPECIES: TetR/AcrR family transcriptional regulator [unclassified Streptomyces]WSQ79648.1 TetR/AcrR family transcriptional regulator [Streptomyces sp. NBC_01213]TXS13038.1 TetR/AcrR family transcriptional regulator [Streptomyces sp. wa22]WLQ66206.1 TetR/AcrR family transcriptional regulator [Streptomyces sp. Alt3]WSQ87028.1 TetR/AcrR family transcriptional regulator [Streptomyces sp. NBC_01212]WSR06952.1 TetR/AcrR family transcriptional regulator [Streptomyces sp. NBC_01208]